MTSEKTYFPLNIQKLKGLLADQGQPFNKNKLTILALIFAVSIALGIFIVNMIGLLNSSVPISTTTSIGIQKAVPIERPVTTTQTVHVKATSTETAPPISVKEKTAVTPKIDRFTIDSHLYRARGYEIKGEYSKALASYQKVLDVEKDNFVVLNNISYIYLQLDLLKESIEYSLMAIKTNSDYVPALANLGIAHAKTGELESAEYHLARALELEPANQDVRLNLALLLEKEGRFTEAAENYSKLVKAGNLNGALGLGRVYEKEGKTAEAIMFYKDIYESGSIDNSTRSFARKRIIILRNKQRGMLNK